MEQKRIAQRHRVLKAGTIEFNGGGIDCTLRNVSETGAALDVTSPVGIPAAHCPSPRSNPVGIPAKRMVISIRSVFS